MKTLTEFEELLHKFQSKARCSHSQRSAKQAWNALQPYLDDLATGWKSQLSTAWWHVEIEGPDDLDHTCGLLLEQVVGLSKAWDKGRKGALKRTVQ